LTSGKKVDTVGDENSTNLLRRPSEPSRSVANSVLGASIVYHRRTSRACEPRAPTSGGGRVKRLATRESYRGTGGEEKSSISVQRFGLVRVLSIAAGN
jgi:hypothetical protein